MLGNYGVIPESMDSFDPDISEKEELVRAMERVIDEEEQQEPESDEQWVRAYEIACQRLLRDKIKIK